MKLLWGVSIESEIGRSADGEHREWPKGKVRLQGDERELELVDFSCCKPIPVDSLEAKSLQSRYPRLG
jgi:hypothetical protein